MENIPKKLFERDIETITCGITDVYFFKENELDEGQEGFRYNRNREKITDWIGEDFYVVGIDSTCGDPIIADFSKEELPIYYMFHDDWSTLEMIAYNLEQFIQILHMIDNTDVEVENEKNNLIASIKEICPDEGFDYWEGLIESAYDYFNDI